MKHSDRITLWPGRQLLLRPMIVFLHNFVHTNKKWFQLHIFGKSGKKKKASSNKNTKGALFISDIHFLLLIIMLISILLILNRISQFSTST